MLSTYIQSRTMHPVLVRVGAILLFAALTAMGARLTIELPFTPVPITLQVLAALLAGLVLGPRDGAASQVAYVAAITAGLPIDAGGLGAATWMAPSAGYIFGFVAGAALAGWLAEMGARRSVALRFGAALAGVAAIYVVGAAWLTYGFLGGDWAQGWVLGIAPFIVVDAAKAVIAAGLAEGVRAGLGRLS